MLDAQPMFSCASCARSYTWKPELGGKRAKCKCGNVMTVPTEPPKPPESETQDNLYDFADAPPAKPAPSALPSFARASAARAMPVPADAVPVAAVAAPLNYQRGPTEREKYLASGEVFIDKRRDLHAPITMLVIGVVMYISLYAIHYSLGPAGIAAAAFGLTVVAVIETALLIAFAFAVAGPLGVSFGGVGTAILKLAAVVVMSDAIITLADFTLTKFLGPAFSNGIFGLGVIGLPLTFLIYLCSFIYLFSMDPGDAKLVVVILTVLYRVIRLVLILMLLGVILNFSGVHQLASAMPAGGSASSNRVTDMVEDAKGRGLLEEAGKYCTDRGMNVEGEYVKDWYDAGCKNVWFEVSRDINGHGSAFVIFLEMPDDPTSRAKCVDIVKKYYDRTQQYYDPNTLKDDGDQYMAVSMPFR
jgi:hypothetical protein